MNFNKPIVHVTIFYILASLLGLAIYAVLDLAARPVDVWTALLVGQAILILIIWLVYVGSGGRVGGRKP